MNDSGRPKPTEFCITLRFAAAQVPAIIRLRRFLKMAWRAYGFKVVRIEEVPAQAEPPPGQGS